MKFELIVDETLSGDVASNPKATWTKELAQTLVRKDDINPEDWEVLRLAALLGHSNISNFNPKYLKQKHISEIVSSIEETRTIGGLESLTLQNTIGGVEKLKLNAQGGLRTITFNTTVGGVTPGKRLNQLRQFNPLEGIINNTFLQTETLVWGTTSDWDNATSQRWTITPSDYVTLTIGTDGFEDIEAGTDVPSPPYDDPNRSTVRTWEPLNGTKGVLFERGLGMTYSNPTQPSKIEFPYWTSSDITGWSIYLEDPNGNNILGFGDNNPQLCIEDANGANIDYFAPSDPYYEVYRKFTIDFDWANETFDVIWEDIQGNHSDQILTGRPFMVSASEIGGWREKSNPWSGGPPSGWLRCDDIWGVYDKGSHTTGSKFFPDGANIKPDFKGLEYAINNGSITLTAIGSPGSASEEQQSVTLDGAKSYELSWTNAHNEFRVAIDMVASGRMPSSLPEVYNVELEGAPSQ